MASAFAKSTCGGLVALVLLVGLAGACGGQQAATTTAAPKQLAILNGDGKPSSLAVTPETLVVAVASWCQVSRQFVRFVQDERIKPMLAGYRLVFVFEREEWGVIESKLQAQDPSLKQNPAKLRLTVERLKSDAGGGPLYNPEFLDALPGTHYLLADERPAGLDSFPSMFDHKSGAFSEHAALWIAKNLADRAGMDQDKFLAIWSSHESTE
jgi:hypothetical protein